jgi:hypothetical protein
MCDQQKKTPASFVLTNIWVDFDTVRMKLFYYYYYYFKTILADLLMSEPDFKTSLVYLWGVFLTWDHWRMAQCSGVFPSLSVRLMILPISCVLVASFQLGSYSISKLSMFSAWFSYCISCPLYSICKTRELVPHSGLYFFQNILRTCRIFRTPKLHILYLPTAEKKELKELTERCRRYGSPFDPPPSTAM